MEHLALGVFPAIDGARSTSTLPLSEPARVAKQRLGDAVDLRAWFHQPMYVAQEFTGEHGTWVAPETTDAELLARTR